MGFHGVPSPNSGRAQKERAEGCSQKKVFRHRSGYGETLTHDQLG